MESHRFLVCFLFSSFCLLFSSSYLSSGQDNSISTLTCILSPRLTNTVSLPGQFPVAFAKTNITKISLRLWFLNLIRCSVHIHMELWLYLFSCSFSIVVMVIFISLLLKWNNLSYYFILLLYYIIILSSCVHHPCLLLNDLLMSTFGIRDYDNCCLQVVVFIFLILSSVTMILFFQLC